ncbi:MAG TPA: N-formylglutamate amidohydrolase [Sphingomicrobium sp.]|nr:N-formylglutamate amidohydrolase [Sphingomicrobium sp.]
MSPLPPPIVHPPRGKLPVVLSVPHSGRDYPDWLLSQARRGLASLQPLEDPFVDRLVWRALGNGAAAVIAQAPRAAVDCNRAEDEIDPALVHLAARSRLSPRARGGLGIIPSRTAAHGHLWRRPIASEELERRLDEAYRPYHQALEAQLSLLVDRFGCALLLDCHSMPPSKNPTEIVFGDRFGRSAAPWVIAEALAIARESGFAPAANDPFAGGHILDRHGSPNSQVHALQIEIDRRCYLGSSGEPGGDFDRISELIEKLALRLGALLLDRRAAAAAE